MTELVYEIAGKKYVLVDVPFVEGHSSKSRDVIRKYGLLYQGIKEISRGSLLTKGFSVQTFFCPEENFIAFSNDDIKLG